MSEWRPAFDPSFDGNAIGPIPVPDGGSITHPEYRSVRQASKPSTTGKGKAGPSRSVFDAQPSLNALGIIPGYPAKFSGGGEMVENGRDETEVAFETLLQHQPAGMDDYEAMNSLLDPTLENGHDDTHDASSPFALGKRKATSRINMLARGGACEFCKRRKLKCTAEMPTCAACARAGRECVYSQTKQRSRVRVLEDRLLELEKKLDTAPEDSSATPSLPPSMPPDAIHVGRQEDEPADAFLSSMTMPDSIMSLLNQPPSYPTPHSSSGVSAYPTPTDGFRLPSAGDLLKSGEPDLMTLADAAAADMREGRPWEGMLPSDIADAIMKGLEGGKGIGEKIIAHL